VVIVDLLGNLAIFLFGMLAGWFATLVWLSRKVRRLGERMQTTVDNIQRRTDPRIYDIDAEEVT
jgi:hypothetical protein